MQLATQVLDQLRNGGLRPVCGRVDRNIRESRYDLEMQDTLSLGDNLRLLNGLSYRYDQANSETFYGGRVSSQIWRLFSQLEWHAGEHWLLQGGGMLEDVEGSGSSFSPRLAVNYLFNPQHSLRAVYSEAVRSPGMYENDVDWRYRVPMGRAKPTTSPAPTAPATWARNTPVRARSATTVFSARPGWPWMYACSTRKSPD